MVSECALDYMPSVGHKKTPVSLALPLSSRPLHVHNQHLPCSLLLLPSFCLSLASLVFDLLGPQQ